MPMKEIALPPFHQVYCIQKWHQSHRAAPDYMAVILNGAGLTGILSCICMQSIEEDQQEHVNKYGNK